jgi:2-iminobutanoate/2-iminopropanoate deaminase
MTHSSHVVEGLPAPGGGYSHVTRTSEGVVFTAGFGPHDPRTGTKATVHLAELQRDFAAFDAAYRRVMPEPFPVRTTVGSQLLGILVEVDVVASVGAR